MKPYRVLLFDLDGTLTDPKPGITRSVQHALKRMGIVENDLDSLVPYWASFERFISILLWNGR